jgi:alkylation response protein AidB-like acyl-CoA dehydrogenase
MNSNELIDKLRSTLKMDMPLPASGRTADRHRLLMQMGCEDLSFARLAEAHWDAVAILMEAEREPTAGAIYGVWASETPSQELQLESVGGAYQLSGSKRFCTGAALIDRALVTVLRPVPQLVDVDLHARSENIKIDDSNWKTPAFAETHTATVDFLSFPVSADCPVGDAGFYLNRAGFWHGACGPAACWAGGAKALVDYAARQKTTDPHALAHVGAMQADVWALECYLERAGFEIDTTANSQCKAQALALKVRHLVEQTCTDILRRLERAFGPRPLAFDEEIGRRCTELQLYLRQTHAELDLELLARGMHGLANSTEA